MVVLLGLGSVTQLSEPFARYDRLCHRSDCGAAGLPCRTGAEEERLSPLCAALFQSCLPLGSRETLQIRPLCHGGTMGKEESAGRGMRGGCRWTPIRSRLDA